MFMELRRASLAAVLMLACGALPAGAQGPLTTAFTYQGELRASGVLAVGPHDMRFRLYREPSGGTQIGPTLCADNVALANGRFAVDLDFGALFAGDQSFLEIETRPETGLDCNSAAGFVILSPRQPLSATPNAAFALTAASATTAASAATATNASQLNGQGAGFYQNAGNLNAGTIPDARLAGTYSGGLTLSNAGNVFAGSGAGLVGLNAANLATGTLADARLSANVALLGGAQTFTGAKTFSAAPSFTGVGSPFTVTSTGVVTNLNADLLDGLNSTAFLQAVPVPLTLTGSNNLQLFKAENTATSFLPIGVYGLCSGATGATTGVRGEVTSTGGKAIVGFATATTGTTYGGFFQSNSSAGYGVYGLSSDMFSFDVN